MPRSNSSIALVLALSLVAPVVRAQPAQPARAPAAAPPSEEKKAEARAHFEKAVALFEEEAWDAALTEFMASLALYPTRAATKNAAICLRKLHRYDESLDMFEVLVRDFPNLPQDDRELADRQLKELRGLVGFIDVRGAEQGAKIVVDERTRGTFPAAPVRVSAGTHVVRVYKEGLVPFESRVEIAGGQTGVVNAKLQPLAQSGRLTVTETAGKSLDVVVDNVVVGKTPWEGPLAVGDHTVVLRGEGNVGTQPANAPINLNRTTPLALTAEALAAQLRVEPIPAGASVAMDGVVVGRGIWDGRLRPGAHRVEVAAEGFLPATRQLSIDAGKRETVSVALERDLSSPMWAAVNPPKFMFEIDGAFAMAPVYGGDLVDACSGGCSAGMPLGAMGRFHGGYQLRSGLGFAVDLGYLSMASTISNRDAKLHTLGFGDESSNGGVEDKLHLRGLMVGASAALHRGTTFPFTLRLGVGVLVGSVTDTRSGSFTTVNTAKPIATYSTALQESPSASYLYLAPELRIAYRFLDHVELSVGVTVLVMKSLSTPSWKDQNAVTTSGDGLANYGTQSVAGSLIVVPAPGLGARYDF